MKKASVKKKLAAAVTGAVSTAAAPASMGVIDWRVLAGAAVLGAVGGFFGFDIAGAVKRKAQRR